MMEEGSHYAKLDYDSLQPSQKQFHERIGQGQEPESRYYYDRLKYAWSARHTESCDPTQSGKTIFYEANSNFQFILKSTLRTVLPAITVVDNMKETLRVAWQINVGYNMIKSGSLCYDSKPCQKWFDRSLDVHANLEEDRDKQKELFYLIGNRDGLQEWKTEHPETPINIPLPYYYSEAEISALKLCLCNNSSVTHKFEFADIKELLRIESRDANGVWKTIAFNQEHFVGTLQELTIPIPNLFIDYSLSPSEIPIMEKLVSNDWIYDIVFAKSKEPHPGGKPFSIELQSKKECHMIYWIAQNEQSRLQRQYSNYTTNPNDIRLGKNPCGTMSLSYGQNQRVVKKPADHSSELDPFLYAKGRPRHKGYNMHMISHEQNNLDHDIGIIHGSQKTEITIDMVYTDPEQTYNIYVFCKVKTELQYKDGKCLVVS